MMHKGKQIRICGILIALNLIFIWGNSLLPGELSGALSDWVKELLSRLLPVGGIGPSGGGLLRKLAHFAEFALLGLLLTRFFRLLGKKYWYALPWGVLAAAIDETIQIFVPGRGPGLRDVGIDTCGVLTGMVLLQFGYFLWKQNQSKRYGGNE